MTQNNMMKCSVVWYYTIKCNIIQHNIIWYKYHMIGIPHPNGSVCIISDDLKLLEEKLERRIPTGYIIINGRAQATQKFCEAVQRGKPVFVFKVTLLYFIWQRCILRSLNPLLYSFPVFFMFLFLLFPLLL